MEGSGGEDLRTGDGTFGAVRGAAGGEGLGRCAEDFVLCGEALDFTFQAFFFGEDGGVRGCEVVELDL